MLVFALFLCAAAPVLSQGDGSASEIKDLLHKMRDSQASSLSGAAVVSPKAAAAAEKSYSFPYTDVDDFDPRVQTAEPPYCVRYADGGKSLVFIAAAHSPGAGKPSPTLPMVDKLFAAQPGPEVLIVERNDDQVKDAGMIARYADEGEAEHALQLAGKTGAQAKGGDPKPYEQLSAFLSLKTFTVADFEGFYVIRTLNGERKGRFKAYFDSGKFDGLVERVAGEFQGEFQGGSAGPELFKESDLFTTSTFKNWYLEKNKKVLDFAALKDEETWPAKDASLFSRQVAAGASRVRDYFLGSRIAAGLNSRERVLVVYGGGHHVEIARALKTMLGSAPLPCD